MINKETLEQYYSQRNTANELTLDKPDPLYIAKQYNNENIALICALFSYGNARQIVKFLGSLNFDLLHEKDNIIQNELKHKYYRFQNSQDIVQFFISIKRLYQYNTLEELFFKGYKKNNSVLEGINSIIKTFNKLNNHQSKGYNFLLGSILKDTSKHKGTSTYKRWNMYLRWMVRCDNLDLGLWKNIRTEDLIIPLDTHTFHVSQRLGLLQRKTYDLEAAILLTNKLKEFDPIDPVKYDFALYRIGQEQIL